MGTAAEAAAHFTQARGEVVLVIEGREDGGATEEATDDEAALRDEVAAMRAAGLTRAQAAVLLERRYQVSRRRLYRMWLEADA